MRRLFPIISLLLPTAAVHAQAQPDDLASMATQVARDLADAERALDQAFNLLGLLEAFSLVVTIVGGAGVVFGVTRFIAAQNQLRESRRRFENEILRTRRQLREETRQREETFAGLQGSLQAMLEKSTGDATRALSLLPLGERQYRSGDFRGARAIYGRALQLDPGNPVINYRMGYTCSQAGALDEAERYLRQALAGEPDFAPALANLGYVYRRRAEQLPEGVERARAFNEAESHLTQALSLLPNLVDDDGESWWGSLGGLYRRRGQMQEAVHAYREAARVTPSSSYAWVNLALLGMQQDGADAMRDTWRQAQQLAAAETRADVDNYWGYADLVTTSLALGDAEQAEEALASFFRTIPAEAGQVPQVLRDSLEQLAASLPEERRAAVQAVIGRIEAQASDG